MEENITRVIPKICPLCNSECEKVFIENNFSLSLINCPRCKDFIFETMSTGKDILDEISKEEKFLLADYFSKLPTNHTDRRTAITINSYKEFIKRAKELN